CGLAPSQAGRDCARLFDRARGPDQRPPADHQRHRAGDHTGGGGMNGRTFARFSCSPGGGNGVGGLPELSFCTPQAKLPKKKNHRTQTLSRKVASTPFVYLDRGHSATAASQPEKAAVRLLGDRRELPCQFLISVLTNLQASALPRRGRGRLLSPT